MKKGSISGKNTMDIDALTWAVIYHDINGDRISTFDIFHHGGFKEDIRRSIKKISSKEEFATELRRSLFYYFGSKSEWEIVVGPWCGGKNTKEIKVDVYWQVMNNWGVFLEYVWSARPQKLKEKDKTNECDR